MNSRRQDETRLRDLPAVKLQSLVLEFVNGLTQQQAAQAWDDFTRGAEIAIILRRKGKSGRNFKAECRVEVRGPQPTEKELRRLEREFQRSAVKANVAQARKLIRESRRRGTKGA